MLQTNKIKPVVSLFQIPEDYRVALEKIANGDAINLDKQSINSCILEALDSYLNLAPDSQSKPILPKVPLRAFTVRTSSELKQKINYCATNWQLKTAMPISMNAVVNTAILQYLKKLIQGYHPPF